ncbi:twin-arginine translocation signal domain-containing protein [Glycomyces sp. A-F 0318]|uniref:SCO7613 C-terminal domain-containing membrane protein n=1 Tax=Glycomyces amatae TaxID=2881355 RepID=UPI001E376341|nr:twin-arginine translocation signal domain-containing protein [Glycomyces amatae]MCD0443850.1 twin-arginine translocation signal domain-containing protein [Glycomyces amatae]
MNRSVAPEHGPERPPLRNQPPRPEDARTERTARAARRAEVTAKTVQTVLLCLGGLLLTAGIIVFTAVAWRQLGDGGRLTILAGATGLLLATPLALTRFRLWATAETLAATAVLALWCSALAGYYLYLPSGTGLTAVAVARWTALVLAAAVLYRFAARVSAPGWALLPLAAAGTAFAAFGEPLEASIHMGVIGAVLAGAAAAVKAVPTRHAASDQWAARVLAAAAITVVFLAGLRAAFGLDAALLPAVAATACLLASALLLATAHARGTGAARATVLILGAATAALTATAWTLALRTDEPLLAVPGFGLAAAIVVVLAAGSDPNGPAWLPPTGAAAVAVASLATLGAVVTGALALTAYCGAALLVLAASAVFPAPLSQALRRAAAAVGAGVLAWCAALGLTALPVAFGAEPNALLRWEVPAAAAACAVGAAAVREGWRRDFLALAAAAAALGAGGVWDRPWAPAASLALVTAAALLTAFTSPGAGRRVAGWTAAYLSLPVAALAATYERESGVDYEPAFLACAVVASALLAAVQLTRGPARSAGGAGAHASMGLYLAVLSALALEDGVTLYAPLGFLAYAVALAVAALASPRRRLAHALGSCGAAIAAQLLLTAYAGAYTLEYYTVPPAVLLLGVGLWMLRRDPERGSWVALAPAIAVGFGPSLVLALGLDGEPWRRAAVGAAALLVLLAAANRRWQAPLVLAAVVLAASAVNEIALAWSLVPMWAPLSVGGAVLIAAGATLEQRRRDLARLSRSVKAMR